MALGGQLGGRVRQPQGAAEHRRHPPGTGGAGPAHGPAHQPDVLRIPRVGDGGV